MRTPFLALVIWLLFGISLTAAAQESAPGAPAAVAASTPLRLGIVPYTTPQSLLRIYRSYRQFLSSALGRPVLILTAPSHQDFLRDAEAGRFDIIIATSHQVPDMMEKGMVPILKYTTTLRVALVSRTGHPLEKPRDLAGLRIALPDRYSLLAIVGLHYLNRLRTTEGIDTFISYEPSHTAALMSVVRGTHDVALTALQPLRQLPPEMRARLIPARFEGPVLPPLMTLVSDKEGPELTAKIRAALLDFEKSQEGFNFFQSTGYVGYQPILPADIEALKPYSDLLNEALKEEESLP
ncbi:MAG: phosphate/phosphite/phosphonate ABC transporter substrate-binding protein [Zoogloeaceae bacterium]|nr:phosphate/phosphite/phosphonate ABC transporter substrate-binding protein [Zoogloeaceae bacterium]